jgi:hypothetical protein
MSTKKKDTTMNTIICTANDTLIPAKHFQAVKISKFTLKIGGRMFRVDGWGCLDLRNGKLVNMNDGYFFCLRVRKHMVEAIKEGLYEGFTHYPTPYCDLQPAAQAA